MKVKTEDGEGEDTDKKDEGEEKEKEESASKGEDVVSDKIFCGKRLLSYQTSTKTTLESERLFSQNFKAT